MATMLLRFRYIPKTTLGVTKAVDGLGLCGCVGGWVREGWGGVDGWVVASGCVALCSRAAPFQFFKTKVKNVNILGPQKGCPKKHGF